MLVLSDQAPAAALVSVARSGRAWFVVVRGEIPAVVGRSFDPELDVPYERLDVSLKVGEGRLEHSSRTFSADRERWSGLLEWAAPEPRARLRVRLELDGRSIEYVLARPD